ncbi:MAG: phage tail sheath subtilisin-like domain-containing protein [bacterium]
MPEYLAPGVYVEEVDTGPKPIEGVSTSTSGMVGVTERGPVNVPTLVTGFADFRRQFGGYLDRRIYSREAWYLPHAVEGFFNNVGKRLYIVRVLPDESTFGEVCIDIPIRNAGIVLGTWALAAAAAAGDVQLTLNNVNNLSPGMWLQIDAGNLRECIYVTDVDNVTNIVTLDQPLRFAHANPADGPPVSVNEVSDLIVRAIDPGRWGNDLRVNVTEDNLVSTRATAVSAINTNTITIAAVVGVEMGSTLEVGELYTVTAVNLATRVVTINPALTVPVPADTPVRPDVISTSVEGVVDPNNLTLRSVEGIDVDDVIAIGHFYKVTAVNSTTRVVTLSTNLIAAVAVNNPVRSREFSLRTELLQRNPITLQTRVIDSETVRNLAADPRHSRYMVRVLGPLPTADTPLRADGRTEGESDLIRAADGLTRAHGEAATRTGPAPGASRLSGGTDAENIITDNTYLGQDGVNPQDRTGLFALRNIEEISIVAIPGRTNQQVQEALINHCELQRYRFAVIDSQRGDGIAEVQEQRGFFDTKYAALYYPWLSIPDPFPENPQAQGTVLIPPAGHMMGIYARSDIERGVHKAPANETIRGISDLEVKLMKEHQDILNPRNINVLRNFRENNRGLRVWGARTISSDPDWKYVNVRRLFIFVEHSIDRGTQWVVFEPNSEPLWERVRRVVSAFLTQVWRDGALMGRTPEEAYFVKVDRTTMTQNDIDNGRLIIQVGIAPVKPAEFVIFRIGQWVGGSELTEG